MLERIHLSIVQQVEQQGSLTAAAGVLNLTQSALSHSMKKLEQQLGTDVWLREGRSLRLTQAGQYLLAVANRVLPQLDLAEERLGQFAQGERGALRIGDPYKAKCIGIHWEFMFARSRFGTADRIEQHRILSRAASMIDAGQLRGTLGETLGRINAANLDSAHQRLASGRTVGKLALAGWDD